MLKFLRSLPVPKTREVPCCTRNITRDITPIVKGEKDFDEFFCKGGQRDVTLFPGLTPKSNYSIGCDGCCYHTDKEKGG
jgi:hypothetical protein